MKQEIEQDKRKKFIGKGADVAIANAMSIHKDNVKVQRRCLASLWKLSPNNENDIKLFQDEIIDPITQAAEYCKSFQQTITITNRSWWKWKCGI